MDIQFLIVLASSILNIELAGMIFVHGFKKRSNRYFILTVLAIAAWILFNYFSNAVKDYSLSLLYNKLIFVATAISGWAFLIFSDIFPEETAPKKKIFWPSLFLLFSVIFVSLSRFLIKEISIKKDVSEIVFNDWGISFFAIFLLGCFLSGLGIIINKTRLAKNKENKKTLQLLLGGMTIFLSLSILTNLFFPVIYNNFQLTNLAPLHTVIFTLIFAVAILKYQFLDVKVIISEMLAGLMGTVLFLFACLMDNNWLRIMAFGLFSLFCIIGYLLIKYTYREISAKEDLETKVRERTKELAESKTLAEERAAELEKWYKLTIGRELRMAELKDKIKELEGKKITS
jgi:hypothetical protein